MTHVSGNGLTIICITTRKHMKTVTNIPLVSLAFADITNVTVAIYYRVRFSSSCQLNIVENLYIYSFLNVRDKNYS